MNFTDKLFETETLTFIPSDDITIGDVTMGIGKQSLVLRELDDGITVGIKVQIKPKDCKKYASVGDWEVVHNGNELWTVIKRISTTIMNEIIDYTKTCNPEEWDKRSIVIVEKK